MSTSRVESWALLLFWSVSYAGCVFSAGTDATPDAVVSDASQPEAGDSDPGADASPDGGRSTCSENEYVSSNMCVACPSGQVSDGGDPISGPNTECFSDGCSGRFGVSCARFADGFLKAPDAEQSDFFGGSVSLSGTRLAVGAFGEDQSCSHNGSKEVCLDSGAVYIFEREGGSWSQTAHIKASNAGAGDRFGWSVSLDGDRLAVGALYEGSCSKGVGADKADDACAGAGAVYLFERTKTSGDWTEIAYIKSANTSAGDEFGHSIALEGDLLFVGAPREQPLSCPNPIGSSDVCQNAGAAYLFQRKNGGWSSSATLRAPNGGRGHNFGFRVDVSGTHLAVSAPNERNCTNSIQGQEGNDECPFTGAVYVYDLGVSDWMERPAYVKASNADSFDQFGISLDLDSDRLAVGAANEASCAMGVDPNRQDDNACSNDREGAVAAIEAAGAVYVFERGADGWTQDAYIKALNTAQGDRFGWSVALGGSWLAVGARGERGCGVAHGADPKSNGCQSAGAAYLYEKTPVGSWSEATYVKSTTTHQDEQFGYSVSVSERQLVVGAFRNSGCAPGLDGAPKSGACPGAGAAHLWRLAP